MNAITDKVGSAERNAFEEHFQSSWEDPTMSSERKTWSAAWAAREQTHPTAQEAEPAGYRISAPEEPEIGSWFSETPTKTAVEIADDLMAEATMAANRANVSSDDYDISTTVRIAASTLRRQYSRIAELVVEPAAMPGDRAAAPRPQADAGAPTDAAGIAATVCRQVAELPDRDSPEDWPEAMLVTADELRMIVRQALGAAAPAQEAEDGWMPIETAPEGERVLLGPRHAPVVGTVQQPKHWHEEQEPTATVVHYNGNVLVAGYRCSEWRRLPGAARARQESGAA